MLKLRLVLAALALLALDGGALAHGYKAGSISIEHPFANATPPAATRGAAYMKLANQGAEDDALVSATGAVADKIEIHQTTVADGVVSMRPVPDGLTVPAGAHVDLTVGSYHLMLIGLKQPLVAGQRIPIVLSFRHAGDVAVELAVEAPKDQAAGAHAGH
ncbi:copper chaperone PCu(A)C [Mesorhizobium sp. DCY119]|uniref:copper chaperone PCu(A)C n=1 Tax=Mesorhizobium sp. DCY119 TaxID=2108445 RepID=UPI000E74D775|nr:copper chaperone PCu(A)C [Mesorhizobium sp. DCY119]RJG40508.1 copper chaperone PCu(A)C [Mesorhizobium sp. DCY119]